MKVIPSQRHGKPQGKRLSSSVSGVQLIGEHTKHTVSYEKRFSTNIESQGHFFQILTTTSFCYLILEENTKASNNNKRICLTICITLPNAWRWSATVWCLITKSAGRKNQNDCDNISDMWKKSILLLVSCKREYSQLHKFPIQEGLPWVSSLILWTHFS